MAFLMKDRPFVSVAMRSLFWLLSVCRSIVVDGFKLVRNFSPHPKGNVTKDIRCLLLTNCFIPNDVITYNLISNYGPFKGHIFSLLKRHIKPINAKERYFFVTFKIAIYWHSNVTSIVAQLLLNEWCFYFMLFKRMYSYILDFQYF